jgi:hypothetical protein
VDPTLKGFSRQGFGYRNFAFLGHGSGKIVRMDMTDFSGASTVVMNIPERTGDADLVNYGGAFESGGFGYLVPYHSNANGGRVVRFSLNDFPQSIIDVLDLPTATGDGDLTGFMGGFAHGQYGILVPYHNGNFYGKVVRFHLSHFNSSGVEVIDLPTVMDDTSLTGFHGGFSSGPYGVLVPYIGLASVTGKIVRFVVDDFTASSVSVLD